MIRVEIFTKPDCHLCEEAKQVLLAVQAHLPFELCEINIETNPTAFEKFKEEIPVIFVDGRKAFKFRVTEKELLKRLQGSSK